jgi:CheY-like chemotaxis protein
MPRENQATVRSAAMHTVLVVDDNESNRDLAKLLLRRRFNVLTASSAGSALGLARRQRPDLIVSGVRMPGVDGLELPAF